VRLKKKKITKFTQFTFYFFFQAAYFAPNPSNPSPLRTIDEISLLRDLGVPEGMYQPARVGRGMGRHRSTAGLDPTGTGQGRGIHISPDSDEEERPSNDNFDRTLSKNNHQTQHRSKKSDTSIETPESSIHRSASTSNSVLKSGPPPLAIATMPVVPSQLPSRGLALQPVNQNVSSPGSSISCNISPPPPSPSARSILSVSTSEPSISRRGCMVSQN
jgi:hypothetical protein